MTTRTDTWTILHVTDATRPDLVDGVERLLPTARGSGVRDLLDGAALLVVDDALAFPFETLRDADRDIPLAVRVPVDLDVAGLEAVLGSDLLDDLTPLDVVAGPARAWQPVLRRRGLPTSRHVGGVDVSVDELVNRARHWRRRFEAAYRPRHTPKGAPLLVPDPGMVVGHPSPDRVRQAKSLLRVERGLLRAHVDRFLSGAPPAREPSGVLLARRPARWASALAGIDSWTAVSLVEEGDPDDDLVQWGVGRVSLPDHLRLPLAPARFDLAIVVGDLLHSPEHAVLRLFEEAVRLVRPGGILLAMAETVPDPCQPVERRSTPPSASRFVDLVSGASGRRLLLEDVTAYRRPGEDYHRAGVFRWRYVGTDIEGLS